MLIRVKAKICALVLVPLFLAEAVNRPDYYTSRFYTRGVSSAFYIDQGGEYEPYSLPAGKWSMVPRVTISGDGTAHRKHDQEPYSNIRMHPGLMVIYGRPNDDHLFVDAGFSHFLKKDDSIPDKKKDFFVTVGGVKEFGKSQVWGQMKHRRIQSADPTLVLPPVPGSIEDFVSLEGVSQKSYVADLGVEHRISTKTSVGLNTSAEFNRYENEGYVDYDRYYLAGRFYHRVTEKSEWFTQAGIGVDKLHEEQRGVYSDAVYYDVSLGMRGRPTSKTSVSGRVGYRFHSYDDSSISDERGVFASLGAETTPYGFSTFYTELLADIRPDVGGDGHAIEGRRAQIGVNRRLFSEKLRGDASVVGGEVDTHGPDGTSKDEYWGVRLALDWEIRWNLSAGVSYAYTDRRTVSGDEGSPYEIGYWNWRVSWNY